jgi:hypothetical protein
VPAFAPDPALPTSHLSPRQSRSSRLAALAPSCALPSRAAPTRRARSSLVHSRPCLASPTCPAFPSLAVPTGRSWFRSRQVVPRPADCPCHARSGPAQPLACSTGQTLSIPALPARLAASRLVMHMSRPGLADMPYPAAPGPARSTSLAPTCLAWPRQDRAKPARPSQRPRRTCLAAPRPADAPPRVPTRSSAGSADLPLLAVPRPLDLSSLVSPCRASPTSRSGPRPTDLPCPTASHHAYPTRHARTRQSSRVLTVGYTPRHMRGGPPAEDRSR